MGTKLSKKQMQNNSVLVILYYLIVLYKIGMNMAGFVVINIVINIWTKQGLNQSRSFTLLRSVTNNFHLSIYEARFTGEQNIHILYHDNG